MPDTFTTPLSVLSERIEKGIEVSVTRAGLLITPIVNNALYNTVLAQCACDRDVLHIFYVTNDVSGAHYFYSLCAEHGIKDLGRAQRAAQAEDEDRYHRRRRSGGSTERWYQGRGR